jgi:hypothetical protein
MTWQGRWEMLLLGSEDMDTTHGMTCLEEAALLNPST